MRRPRTRLVAVAVAVTMVALAACGSGKSILDTDLGSATTQVPDASGPDASGPTVPETFAPTTTVPASDLPACPTDALADADGTVDLTYWYGVTGALGEEMKRLVDAYNASQSNVHIDTVEGSYEETFDKYLSSGQSNRPDVMQLPEYTIQSIVDTESTVPVGQCMTDSDYDSSTFMPTGLAAYASQGVQWAMPFNISNPVLFYNKKVFTAAGLDPDDPPISLEEVRAASEQIVRSGAATYGLALESGFDSGGGWYIEQWLCKAEEFYVNGENGRAARATAAVFDNATSVEVLTFLQQMLAEGLAVNVGDNAGTGFDNLLKLADSQQPAAMTIATSASLGPAIAAVAGGQFPNIGPDDFGIGPMPGPDGAPGVLIGGAALWIVDKGDAEKTAAAWDFIAFLVGAQQQSEWAAATGYTPVRSDAADLDPYQSTLANDPRFGVALEQLEATPDVPTSAGPMVGPLREIRSIVSIAVSAIFDGADAQAALAGAREQADNLIADYNARNS